MPSVGDRVSPEDIYSWFAESLSWQRIDLLCGLLQLCLPLELRFVGACLEDLARKDYSRLRDFERRANELAEYATLATRLVAAASSSESAAFATVADGVQETLNVYLSLLHSGNTACASSIFRILLQIWERFQRQQQHEQGVVPHQSSAHGDIALESDVGHVDDRAVALTSPISDPEIEDVLLLFTMAAYHPAFVYNHRVQLDGIRANVKAARHDFAANVRSGVYYSSASVARMLLGQFPTHGTMYHRAGVVSVAWQVVITRCEMCDEICQTH